jgi:hypothetical protein
MAFFEITKIMLIQFQTVATAADMGPTSGSIKADGKQCGATVQIAPALLSCGTE